MREPQNILIRGVNWLGDAVMTTPALQRLRERFPEASITLLTPEKLSDLWLHHPSVDEIITFKRRESVLRVVSRIRGWKFSKSYEAFKHGRLSGSRRNLNEAVLRAMQFFILLEDYKKPFDLALILPNSPRSALETWLARIPRRIGYARTWRNWMLTDAVPARPGHVEMRKRSKKEILRLVSENPNHDISRITHHASRITQAISSTAAHQIHDYLHLVSTLGATPDPIPPLLVVTPDETNRANDFLLSRARESGISATDLNSPVWLALSPSAAYGPAKCWPTDCFAAVLKKSPANSPKPSGSRSEVRKTPNGALKSRQPPALPS